MNVWAQFDMLLPLAVTWAKQQEAQVLERGVPLNDDEKRDATRIGVREIESVRLLRVSKIAMPHDVVLGQAALQSGFVSSHTRGLTLHHGIFIREDSWRERELVAHELVHVTQYERLGYEEFLRTYLMQCLTVGYANAPLELEAVETATRVLCG